MHAAAGSPWCVSSALLGGLLGGPIIVRHTVALPAGGTTGGAFAEATRGGYGVVGVNDGVLVAG